MRQLKVLGTAAALVLAASTASIPAWAQTLDTVKKRGTLHCGVNVGLAGFSAPDDKGNWTGLDVDFCKAIAVAVLGDDKKIKYVPTTAKERFEALKSGEVDILARNTTWSMSRDTKLSMMFGPVNYYDGQGFMVKKALGVKSAKELKGATVCVQTRQPS
jgi:general L-amino acid transport system substrate-binding protein